MPIKNIRVTVDDLRQPGGSRTRGAQNQDGGCQGFRRNGDQTSLRSGEESWRRRDALVCIGNLELVPISLAMRSRGANVSAGSIYSIGDHAVHAVHAVGHAGTDAVSRSFVRVNTGMEGAPPPTLTGRSRRRRVSLFSAWYNTLGSSANNRIRKIRKPESKQCTGKQTRRGYSRTAPLFDRAICGYGRRNPKISRLIRGRAMSSADGCEPHRKD